MKNIGFTQLDQFSSEKLEHNDVYDTMWIKLLEKIKCIPYPIPNDLSKINTWMQRANLDGIILTGGNDLSNLKNAINPSTKRDQLEFCIIKYCIKNKLPLLGVCRGMQIINFFFNGSLTKIKKHVKTHHNIVYELDEKIRTKSVNSYHNWGIRDKNLSNELEKVAVANDGTIEAIKHKKYPIIGIMWHPERIQDEFDKDDLKTIKNHFFIKCKK